MRAFFCFCLDEGKVHFIYKTHSFFCSDEATLHFIYKATLFKYNVFVSDEW